MRTELKAPDNDDVLATPIDPGTLNKLEEALGKPDTRLEDLDEDGLALIRDLVTQLRARQEVATQVDSDSAHRTEEEKYNELSPERAVTLADLKANYDRLVHLANGVTWADTGKALRASPEKLDKLGEILKARPNGDLTVTGREKGEIMFGEVAAKCPGVKNIVYDREAQTLIVGRGETCNGNAMDIAASFDAKPMLPDHYEPLRVKVPGIDEETWAFLLTDAASRKSGDAVYGGYGIVSKNNAVNHLGRRGVRLELGVKEV